MTDRARTLVATLGLVPHPEGGYYGELHRSENMVVPSDGRGTRPALTTIFFLLPAGVASRWHRVRSDEVWHFYEGDPLDLWMTAPDIERVEHRRLGPLDTDQRPVWTVPANWWQAARSTGAYTLVGCSVGPGFDFEDFALARDQPTVAAKFTGLDPTYADLV